MKFRHSINKISLQLLHAGIDIDSFRHQPVKFETLYTGKLPISFMTACRSWQFLKLRSAAIRLFPGRWSGAKRSPNLDLYLRRPDSFSERFDFRFSIATRTGGDSTSTSQPLAAALYLVATPIGNLEDITLRALRVLREADIVLAEDTRHSQKLLNHYGIKTAMYSLHEHNEIARIDKVLSRLREQSVVALISDAGTPLISDPGARLVKAVVAQNFKVVPVPGPSAVLAALSASGLSAECFTFCGFLPAKSSARVAALKKSKDDSATLVYFVPPHKLTSVLEDVKHVFGGNRCCAVARELTKIHEEFWRGSIEDACLEFAERAPKGEFTLVVEGARPTEAIELSDAEILEALKECMEQGNLPSAAAKLVSQKLNISKNRAYNLATHRQQDP